MVFLKLVYSNTQASYRSKIAFNIHSHEFDIILFNFIVLKQDSEGGGGGCPFCRAEIKGTEQVLVDPFSPDNQVVRKSTASTAENREDNLIDYSADEGKEDEENESEVAFSEVQR